MPTPTPKSISLTVNGKLYERTVEPRTTLVDFLRVELELTGTHVGCEHGVCGACTILWDGKAVRSCIMLAVQADGSQIDTVEGLSTDGELHPIQQAFLEEHGLQCGFCTPGFLMSVRELLERTPDPTDEEIRDTLGGQICRCTGYQSIFAAVKSAAKKMKNAGSAA
jgi:aerobic-type carbon monoxide dehydrogenase small subunit (CoxS/CutS family)